MRRSTAILAMVTLLCIPIAPASAALVAHWTFDEGSSGSPSAQDSAGTNHGTVAGDTAWVPGHIGSGALSFDGDADYVEVPYAAAFDLNDFSVSAWVNPAVKGPWMGILGTRIDGDYTFDLKVGPSTVHADVGDGSAWIHTGIDLQAVDGGDLPANEWHLVTYVIDNTNKRIDVSLDGFLRTSYAFDPARTPLFMQGGQSLRIGNDYDDTEWMNGMIDDVRVYSHALTEAEVFGLAGLTLLTWDKATATEGDWADSNWLPPGTPSYPDADTVAVVENDGPATTGILLVNVTGNEVANTLRLTAPGNDPDLGNYVWLRRTTGWSGGAPDDTFGSLTVSNKIEGAEANNFLVMDQGTSLNTGTADSEISGVVYFGSEFHPGPNGIPEGGGGDDVQIPIEDVLVTTPGNLTILHTLDDATDDPAEPDRRFVKRGAGTLSVDSTTAQMRTINTVFRIEEGTMAVKGADPLGGGSLDLAGGKLVVTAVHVDGSGVGGALASYGFDDSGNLGADTSGQAHHATNYDATYEEAHEGRGGVAYFNGTTAYIEAIAMPAITDGFTFAAWVNENYSTTPAGVNAEPPVLCYQGPSSWGLLFQELSGGQDIRVYSSGKWGWDGGTGITWDTGNWQHLAVTFDATSGDVIFYENGVAQVWQTGQTGSIGDVPDGSTLKIAARASGNMTGGIDNRFKGWMDNVLIYGRALSGTEITDIFGGRPLDLGGLDVLVTADSGFEVDAEGTVPVGTLTLEQGVLTIDGSSDLDLIAFANTVVSEPTGTVGVVLNTETDLGAIAFNDLDGTFSKGGNADLVLDPGNTGMAAATTLEVAGGRMLSVGLGPVGPAKIRLDSGEFVLTSDSGHLTLDQEVSVAGGEEYPNALYGMFYDVGARDRLDPLQWDGGLLTLRPDAAGLLEEPLDFPNDDDVPRFFAPDGSLDGDDYGVVFLGKITVGGTSPLPAGDFSLATASDDGSAWHVDVDGDGFFEELVVSNKIGVGGGRSTEYGEVNLPEGTYMMAIVQEEGHSGDSLTAWGAPGAGITDTDLMAVIDPSALPGVFTGVKPPSYGTLSVGQYLTGDEGPVIVTLNNLVLDGILETIATDGYTISVPAGLSSTDGGVIVGEGVLDVGGPIDVATLELHGDLVRSGATAGDRAVSVSRYLTLLGASLDMSVDPFVLGPNSVVEIGTDQTLRMPGPIQAHVLLINGSLVLDGPQDATVTRALTVGDGAVLALDTLTATGADVTVNQAALSATSAVSAASVNVAGGSFDASAGLAVDNNVGVSDGALTVGGPMTVGGDVNASGGAVNVAGAMSADNLNVSGATVAVAGPTTIATNLAVSGGAFNPADSVTVPTASVTGGAVNLNAGATLGVDAMAVSAGTVHTGTGKVVVSDNLQVGDYTYSADAPFAATGDNLATGQTLTLDVADSTLSIVPPDDRPAGLYWVPITNDADSEIDSAKTYSHAIDFGTSGTATVNGVAFVQNFGTASGTIANEGSTSIPNEHGGNTAHNCTGNVASLFQDMRYNDSTAEVILTGLSEGEWYDFRLYNRQWSVYDRSQDFAYYIGDAAVAAHTVHLNPDDAAADPPGLDVGNRANAMSYVYQADAAGTITVRINQTGGGTYHNYGLTNEVTAAPQPGPISLPNTDIKATANAWVEFATTYSVSIGGLTVADDAILTMTGATDVALGTAGGQGTIVGDFALTGTFAPGADGVGTLNVDNVVMEDGSGYQWELGASGHDTVAVGGQLTLPEVGEEWTLTLFDAGAPLGTPPTELVVFTYGTLVDAPGTLGNYVIDTSNVEHWIFSGDPMLVPDTNKILLANLSEIVALQWKVDADGLWTEPANWMGDKVPNAQNATANFLGMIFAPRRVTVDSDVTVGTINFDNPDHGYTIAGPAEITLDASSGEVEINVLSGNQRIEAPLSLAGNLAVDTADATTLTIDPDVMNLLLGDLTKNGLGALVLTETSPLAGDVTVNAGVLEVGENVLALGSGSNTIYLGEGSTLKAVGTVNHRVVNTGAPGTSTVEAVGALDVGVTTLANGYDYQGALEVGPHSVGLKDVDEAELYGAHMAGGTISSFKGIRLLPINISDGLNSRLYGFGTVNGNVVAGIEGNPTPAVVVADPGQTIELTGVVQTGNSTFVNNVVITGTERLGFSPAVGMKLGGAPIGPDAVVEVYGTAGADFESEIPDALAPPVADPVSGYGQFYVAGGESLVSGKITLSTGGSDYVGRGGDTFELIVTGQAWLMDFTQFPPQNVLLEEGSVNIDPGFIVDTSGIPLASPGLFWQEFRSDQGLTLKIVPEPGTLMLLSMGTLALLAYAWRRRW